jgi:hypothetical protein
MNLKFARTDISDGKKQIFKLLGKKKQYSYNECLEVFGDSWLFHAALTFNLHGLLACREIFSNAASLEEDARAKQTLKDCAEVINAIATLSKTPDVFEISEGPISGAAEVCLKFRDARELEISPKGTFFSTSTVRAECKIATEFAIKGDFIKAHQIAADAARKLLSPDLRSYMLKLDAFDL